MTTINEWLSIFENMDSVNNLLQNDYGEDYVHLDDKRKSILDVLNLHKNKFGNEDIIIIRSPARINLMGRHIDHQGGSVNLIAIDQEIFLTASLREDSLIKAINMEDTLYPEIILDFTGLEDKLDRGWSDLIVDNYIIHNFRTYEGSWENYICAAYLKLAHHFGFDNIRGANICILGNILTAAGLSSSSALTLGVFEALLSLNGLILDDKETINLCAEAEWFVGTRGGSADHAAIKMARKNTITHVKIFSFEILDHAEFPENITLLIFNSNIKAEKSGNKKDLFNQNVLAYDIGFHIIKSKYPEFSERLKFLRDVNKTNLDISDGELFNILLNLPETLNYDQLPEIMGNKWFTIKNKYKFKSIPESLPIRKVVTYGISECHRSEKFFKLIKQGKLREAGTLMLISHNGDRITRYDSVFSKNMWVNEITDKHLKIAIDSNEKIEYIYGGYGCSIPEIDFIIDIASMLDGVYGAQLSGAGLGGCAMILVEKDKVESILECISNAYTEKFKINCLVKPYQSVNGLSIL